MLGRSLDELPPQTRRLLTLVDAFVGAECERQAIDRSDFRFSRRQVREVTRWGETQLRIHLDRLVALEYFSCIAAAAVRASSTSCCTTRRPIAGRQSRGCLSVSDARSLVERYKGEGWVCGNPAERQTDCSFRVGRTRVSIEFEDGKLRTITDADHFGLTGMATRPKVDLCSGIRSRHVLVMPHDDSWIGATIMADGRPVGRVRAGNAEYVSVPLGAEH